MFTFVFQMCHVKVGVAGNEVVESRKIASRNTFACSAELHSGLTVLHYLRIGLYYHNCVKWNDRVHEFGFIHPGLVIPTGSVSPRGNESVES